MRLLLGSLAGAAIVATACGSLGENGSLAGPSASAATSKNTLIVGGRDGVRVIDSGGKQIADLGRVIGTADWRYAFAVAIDSSGNTTLRTVDPGSAATVRGLPLAGRWEAVGGYDGGPTGLSHDGRWLALTAADVPGRFAIVDTTGGVQPRVVNIGPSELSTSRFAFDAISDNGESLYLIEHLVGTQYRVRVLDVRSGLLLPGAIIDVKQLASTADANGVMSGTYTSSAAGPNGQWFFSVYLHPAMGPYVHALNTTSRIAECILDLPTFGKAGQVEMAKQPYWAVVLGKQLTGSRVYAVNGALGEAAVIDPEAVKVTRTSTFKVPRPTQATTGFVPRPAAAVSPDGYRLYALGDKGIFVLDAMDLSLRATFEPSSSFRSLAVAPDNATLYALTSDGATIAALDARTGRPLTTLTLSATADYLAIPSR